MTKFVFIYLKIALNINIDESLYISISFKVCTNSDSIESILINKLIRYNKDISINSLHYMQNKFLILKYS